MEWLSGFLDQIIAFFQWIWDFFAQGIYDFVRDGLVVATKASMYAALPGPIAAGLAFFGVPQALNIIMVAAATRFCMRFVPFIGR
ncbi:Head virion protein G6P [Pseudomonas aeruginosa]|uniref:DUF2523 family protein n=1 Tax=Pseudomonas aeruginosa TaxID=287 RepID=UPI000F52971A|nr:DUF2523 family protein [Pseudomonas aeruginosa]RPQ77041.1 Head virion protein G6P [Pseudomonas aeruginosa]